MPGDRLAPAAAALLESRRTRTAIDGVPADAAPATAAEAYAIQAMVAAGQGSPVVGYKVGSASEASQKLIGGGPFAGRLFASEYFASPAVISASALFMVGVEAEFAFRLGADLPAKPHYTRDDMAEYVSEMVPIIEICDTRFADWRLAGVNQLIADNAFGGGIVAGAPVSDWRGIDFLTQEATLSIDGVELGRGTGLLVQGHPLDSAAWLANELRRYGVTMKAGDLIAAGTCTGLHFAKAGSVVESDFGPYGTVRIEVAA